MPAMSPPELKPRTPAPGTEAAAGDFNEWCCGRVEGRDCHAATRVFGLFAYH